MIRQRINVNGIVQGIGFRPFIYRVASELGLHGYVSNNSDGVVIEIEGEKDTIERFHYLTQNESPPLSRITRYSISNISVIDDTSFKIKPSSHDSTPSTFIPPDIATCDDCLNELFDENDRRYNYPFINCTNCGPRYTIVHGIPYDRPLTSMDKFIMCDECRDEYDNPADRRFHAQPNACHKCGPKLTLCDKKNEKLSDKPISRTIELLNDGHILAIKGIGGFHLVVDPFNTDAVKQLRFRKGRAEKPLALMANSLETIKKYCIITPEEEKVLVVPTRPIVLLKKKIDCEIPDIIAPNNQFLGFMLPYTPLHHMILKGKFKLLVMTSANYSEEPIAIDNDEAIRQLQHIADFYLMHDRDILQRCDDSIVKFTNNNSQLLRRSRGFVPLPVIMTNKKMPCILGVGGELKNTIALSRDDSVFLSQHIGDLDNPKAFSFFENTISHLEEILEIKPEYIAHDLHPEYLSTKWAKKQNKQTIAVQHHHAHMASVLSENNYDEPCIGLILDGTGYGTDNTIWGGEILYGDCKSFIRIGHLKPLPMPGGEKAIKEPWRMALSYLYNAYGNNFPRELPFVKSVEKEKIENVLELIKKKINSPLTSSCGRLFDGISALLGIKTEVNYEAQAAIELEMLATQSKDINLEKISSTGDQIDISLIIKNIVNRLNNNEPVERISLYAHYAIAEHFISSLINSRDKYKCNTIAISGGVFQNKLFSECIIKRLNEENFEVLTHLELPANDGGIALGQIMVANAILNN